MKMRWLAGVAACTLAACGGGTGHSGVVLGFGPLAPSAAFTPLGHTVLVTDRHGHAVPGVTVTLALEANPGVTFGHGSGNGDDYLDRVSPTIPSSLDPMPAAFLALNECEHIAGVYDPLADVIYMSTICDDFMSIDPQTGGLISLISDGASVDDAKGLVFDGLGRLLAVAGSESGDDELYEIDPTDGTAVSLGTMTYAPDDIDSMNGLAIDPTTGVVYAIVDETDEDDGRHLTTLDLGTLVLTEVGTLSEDADFGGDGMAALAFLPDGRLFGVSGENDSTNQEILFEINKATGAVTPVLPLGIGDDGDTIFPLPARLMGTLTAVSDVGGVATFPGLMIDAPATGYTLRATATGAADAVSAPFEIVAPFTGATVAFATATSSVTEGDGPIQIQIDVSPMQSHPIFLQLQLSGSVALPDEAVFPTSDIAIAGVTGATDDQEIFITIPANTATFQLTITPVDDATSESSSEELILTLGNDESLVGGIGLATPGAQITHTLTIFDND